MNYERYGDVLVFDTTYRLNRYDMPFGIFVGVNNNGQSTIFGGALLRNETEETFNWLFKSFVSVLKAPVSILTDQDASITAAIRKNMPDAKHCFWHITRKFPGWFNSILGIDFGNSIREFYQRLVADDIDDFENGWTNLMEKYWSSGRGEDGGEKKGHKHAVNLAFAITWKSQGDTFPYILALLEPSIVPLSPKISPNA